MNSNLFDTLNHAWGTIGPRMLEACVEFAAYVGTAHALITFSGTAALEATLRGLCGDDPDAEVIAASYGDPRAASVAKAIGAKVVFADIDYDTGMLSPASTAKKLSPHTKAVLVESLGGNAPDITALGGVCGAEKLVIWLPCGVGTALSGGFAAAVCDLGAASAVDIGAGALAVNDTALFSRIFAYHNCGRPFGERETLTFGNAIIGGDLRVAEFPCALLPDALAQAEDRLAARRAAYAKAASGDWPCAGLSPLRQSGISSAAELWLGCDRIRCGACHAPAARRGYTVLPTYEPLHRKPLFGELADDDFPNTCMAESGYLRIRL
ncbi:MAG: DegT/DnrJ/EryC1/StrS family aminotransferase [Clostridiaceae bacterium]|nr:DegT/DnrJ/EryC1/StrS family aminotransferase [Clostridiaceae bacterium]